MIASVVEFAAGRIKVMPGTGSNSTAEALRLTQFAEKPGADAALVVAPYYNKPTQQGFYEHYKALAEAVGIPICVYNIPGRTGKNIEPETIARMGELPGITMVKEATGSMDQASQIMALSNLTVLSGDDSLTLPLLSIGARGVISVVGNIVPRDMIALVKAFDAGNLAEALAWHRKLFPLCRDMLGLATNPIPVKAAMRLLGRDTGELRMPMTPLDASQRSAAAGHSRQVRATVAPCTVRSVVPDESVRTACGPHNPYTSAHVPAPATLGANFLRLPRRIYANRPEVGSDRDLCFR